MTPATHHGTIESVRQELALQVLRFARDERGATAIEYAMIAAGVGVAIAATVWSLGTELRQNFYDKLLQLWPSTAP